MKLVDLSVKEFVKKVASVSPAPAGGSAAASCGALAAGLLEMVCNLTMGRAKFSGKEEDIRKVGEKARELQLNLLQLTDEEMEAFKRVMEVCLLPEKSETEKASRNCAIQEATQHATEVPLQTARYCLDILMLAAQAVDIINPSAITDIGICVNIAVAALQSAALNVRINLDALKDREFALRIFKIIDGYETAGQRCLDETMTKVLSGL